MPVAIKSTGGGSVTLTAPSTASDLTLTLPSATGTVALTASPTFSGTVTATTITSPAATALTIQSAGTTAMTVGTNQNIGIGGAVTSDTTYKWLTITGPTTSGGGIVQLNNSDSSVGINMFCNNLAGYVGTSTSHPLLFRINSSETARIDSSGNLCVNTTSATGKANIYAGSAGQIALYLNNANASSSANPVLYCVKYDNTNTTSQVYAQFAYNAGAAGGGQINGNGANQAAFGGFSDARLKENIVNLPSQLANICALRPVEFDYKDGSGHQIGFIAQEMQEVYSDAVGTGADDMLTITGWSKTEARLVAAIQELKADLDAAKAEIATLKGAA
jgi:hypothetical protein